MIFALLASFILFGDIDVAKAALRDGLWEIARNNARDIETDEAKQIILESYAKESNWNDVLRLLTEWGYPEGEIFRLYQATALLKLGDIANAEEQLKEISFESEENRCAAARIKSEIELKLGHKEEALELLNESKADDPVSMMIKAHLLAALGKDSAAIEIFREMAILPEASSAVKRVAALRIAEYDLKDPKLFKNSSARILEIVKDSPDVEGADRVYLQLAKAHLNRGEWSSALKRYLEAQEIWPKFATDTELIEGRGWSYLKLGKYGEALQDFNRLEELSEDPEVKAVAILKAGDALSALNRGTEAMAKYRSVSENYKSTSAAKRLNTLVKIRELESSGREAFHSYRFAEAERFFNEIANLDSDLSDKMGYFRVLCLYGQGFDLEAESLAERISVESRDEKVRTDALLWLAKSVYNRGKWKESQELFHKYALEAPNMEEAPYALAWSARAAFKAKGYKEAINYASELVSRYPNSPALAIALETQGDALIQEARFDEAVLVLERVALIEGISPEIRLGAKILRADALFALGADNRQRYEEALNTYREIRTGFELSSSMKIVIEYKIARTLEKMKRKEEAMELYYVNVLLAYYDGLKKGIKYEEEAKASFSRAAFHLANDFEASGRDGQAIKMLTLVVASDVPAAKEAEKQIERIEKKGKFL